MSASEPHAVTPSTFGIFKVVLVLLGLAFMYLIRDVVAIVCVALFLAALIDPFAGWFQKRHVPRSIAVLLIYVMLLGALALLVALIVPPLRHDIPQLVANLSEIWQRVGREILNIQSFAVERGFIADVQQNIDFLNEGFDNLFARAFSTVRGAVGFGAGIVIMLVLAFYMVVEEHAIKEFFREIAPRSIHSYLSDILNRVQIKIGSWLRGQLALSAVVGLLVYAALLIIGVKAALALALLAAFAEFVPYAGPVFAAIPAIVLALADSPLKGLAVAAAYVVIQQLENHLLVPKIMQRAIGLNPVASIVSLLIGFRIGGVLGALLAIPLATALAVFVTDFLETKAARASHGV